MPAPPKSIAGSIARYQRHVTSTCTARRAANIRSGLRRFVLTAGRLKFHELTPSVVALYVEQMGDRGGVSLGYARELLAMVKGLARWCWSRGWIDDARYHGIKQVSGQPLRRSRVIHRTRPVEPVPEDLLAQWFGALAEDMQESPRPLKVMQITCYLELLTTNLTGCRPSELLGLRMDQIDRTGDVWAAQLESHKTAHHGLDRWLQFGPNAQQSLRAMSRRSMRSGPWLFEAFEWNRPAGRPLTIGAVRRWMSRFAQRRGLETWALNRGRHYGLTEIANAEGMAAAQQLAGHTTQRTTQIYVKPQNSRDAIRRRG